MSRRSFNALFLSGLLCLALGAAAPAFASDAQAEAPQKGLRITYLVFSGRPNPSVVVTDPAQVRAIEERLAVALAPGLRAAPQAAHPVLGYNGILIERLGGAPASSRFVVRRDVLQVEGAAEKSGSSAASEPAIAVSKTLVDLETLLLSLGREQGALEEGVLAVIQSSN
jgi:hypothetical protein